MTFKNDDAPGVASEGVGFRNIGLDGRDLKSLTRLPPEELLRRISTGKLTLGCGHCAGCNREFGPHASPRGAGMLVEPEGIALYQLCDPCASLWQRDRQFRRRIERQAYCSLFKAGPNDVAGSA